MNSLASLVDRIEQQRYSGERILARDLLVAARQIASRQGLPGSYAGMFAPTRADFRRGFRVFTGEPVRSRAAIAHILGEECCRLLLELDVDDRVVSEALARAENEMLERLRSAEHAGFYCCGICTVSFWRHLAAGGLDSPVPRFRDGLRVLKSCRSESGRWNRFPFFYTLLALTEIDLAEARRELLWAAPAAERSLKVLRGTGRLPTRRRAVLEQALALAG
ncbi:hypothetical protein JXD38_04150 [candidate division WOR-3 bacterium]|nr:hypothetical protein [candidate division WOR-3 bacterium]